MARRAIHQLASQMDRYREQHNPLRGLTIVQAISLLEAAQRGQYADLQWTYEFIETTYPVLIALIERRTSTLVEMDYNIKMVNEDHDLYDQALAEEQRAALVEVYDRIGDANLYATIEHLEMASFKGFSIAQVQTDRAGDINHIECLDQWNFVRDGRYGGWGWNPDARDITYASAAEHLDPERDRLIIRQLRRSIDRVGLIQFIRANTAEKDWDADVEMYGIDIPIVIGPENVPEDKEAEYEAAAEDIAQGGGGYMPYGSDVKYPNSQRRNAPFRDRLEWLTEQLVLVGTGGKLTMLTASGSGTLAGGAHSDTFETIGRSEGRKLSGLLQQHVDKPTLNEQFPGRPELAYFSLATEEEQDTGEIVEHFAKLATGGLQIDPEDASERTGYKLTIKQAAAPDPDPVEPSPVTVRNRDAGTVQAPLNRADQAVAAGDAAEAALQAAGRDQLARAMHSDLAPLRDWLQAALDKPDDEMMAALTEIDADGPALLDEMLDAPAAETVIANSMTAAFFNGLSEGVAARPPASEEQ